MYDELEELIKTAMNDPDNWIITNLNIKYHSPNTECSECLFSV